MGTKQTAVEWLFEKLWETPKDKLDWYALLKESKAMEKEHINNGYFQGLIDGMNNSPREYYNETYGN